MKLHVLRHVPFEGAASIAEWAAQRSIPLNEVNLSGLLDNLTV